MTCGNRHLTAQVSDLVPLHGAKDVWLEIWPNAKHTVMIQGGGFLSLYTLMEGMAALTFFHPLPMPYDLIERWTKMQSPWQDKDGQPHWPSPWVIAPDAPGLDHGRLLYFQGCEEFPLVWTGHWREGLP